MSNFSIEASVYIHFRLYRDFAVVPAFALATERAKYAIDTKQQITKYAAELMRDSHLPAMAEKFEKLQNEQRSGPWLPISVP